jgi:hypothetical protein
MIAKAKLTIVLKADETIVAEVEDAVLWQRVLGTINQGTAANSGSGTTDAATDTLAIRQEAEAHQWGDGEDSVEKFAKRLGVSVAVVDGALSPTREPPYLHLNSHNWEAFKKNFPKKGPGAVSHTGLAGTALALWAKEAKLDVPATQGLAAAVLDTINVKDPNASRSVKNTKWLQARAGGTIVINPAEISKAQAIIQAFCLKKAPGNES